MRVAAVDVGTNTALLLVAEAGPRGTLRPCYLDQRFIRLGQGVDATGRVNEAALHRLREALLIYREAAAQWQADRVVVGATSAARDAANRHEVVDFVRRETGLFFEILTGEEEAYWSFVGALSAVERADAPCVVLDIGGGSTELTAGDACQVPGQPVITYRHSLNIGAVRLTERYFSAQPPPSGDVAAAEAFVLQQLRAAALPSGRTLPLVAAAGTATALALVHHGASDGRVLDAPAVSLSYDTVRAWRARLLAASYAEVLALAPAVMAGRADVFAAGVLILETILRMGGWDRCVVSPGGLRHGLAIRALQQVRPGAA
jgi:exopolyphosphatase/guanosine-5'-triphosphate,3'-diphosphate pyrophosphatase